MQKICPCSKPIANENFIFFIIILDLIMGIGTLIGIILPLVGIIIYFTDKNFNSGYFRCYAVTRFVLGIIAMFLLIGLSIYLMAVGIKDNVFFKGVENPQVILAVFFILYVPFIAWHLYLSLNFMNATKKDVEEAEPLTDEENNQPALSQQSKKNLQEEQSVSVSLENGKEEGEKI